LRGDQSIVNTGVGKALDYGMEEIIGSILLSRREFRQGSLEWDHE
jgi:hypothetical protein